MASSFADNAVMAKVRALYGKRISKDDYEQLMQKKTIEGISSYLKRETYFADTFKEVQDESIHRGQLETFVRRRPYDTYVRLVKYCSGDTLFLKMFLMQNDIDQLLLAIRLLNAGEMKRYITSMPVYLTKLTRIDLFALAGIKNYDDLLHVVEKTKYYQTMRAFRPITSERKVDINACETALLTQYYTTLLGIIDKDYSGDTKKELTKLLGFRIRMHNFGVIYRLKRHFHVDANNIEKYIINIKTAMSKAKISSMLEKQDVGALLAIAQGTRIAKDYPITKNSTSAQVAFQINNIQKYVSAHTFRSSCHPMVVVLSYMTLLDVEVHNLTNIIEGTRYALPVEEMRKTLAI